MATFTEIINAYLADIDVADIKFPEPTSSPHYVVPWDEEDDGYSDGAFEDLWDGVQMALRPVVIVALRDWLVERELPVPEWISKFLYCNWPGEED